MRSRAPHPRLATATVTGGEGTILRASMSSILEDVRSSFWFIPTLMAAAAVVVATVTLLLDGGGSAGWLRRLPFIYVNGPDGALSLLSTIAGSMINVAGVVFSLTIVALTLASQQFGPRLLGNFMRDRGNQTVLGTFIATYLYCLLTLRTVQVGGDGEEAFVPHLSIVVALLATIATLGATIYYIHHIASSIQVQNVIGKVVRELDAHVDEGSDLGIFPAGIGIELASNQPLPEDFERRSRPISLERAGHLQAVDGDGLLKVATQNDAIIRLRVRPGAFLMRGQQIADLYPDDLPASIQERLSDRFSVGTWRMPNQDSDALFDQLMELALRALSPASNDPITANSCLDRICDALLALSRRNLPSNCRADGEHRLRLVVPPFDLLALAGRLFGSLRSSIAENLVAATHALERLEMLEEMTPDHELGGLVATERLQLLSAARAALSESDYGLLVRESNRV